MYSSPPPYSLPKLRHPLPQHQQKHGEVCHAARLTPESLSAFCLVASRKRFSLSQCNLEPLELSLELPGKSVVCQLYPWKRCFSVEVVRGSSLPGSTPKTWEKNPRYRPDVEMCFLSPFSWYDKTTHPRWKFL